VRVNEETKQSLRVQVFDLLTDEEKQGLEELAGDDYITTWIDELIELSAIDSVRVKNQTLMETGRVAETEVKQG